MLKIDGHDDAILGPACIWRGSSRVDVLVYDAELIREGLMRDGMTSEEAREFIEFNIEGAYVGEGTPVLVWTQDMWDQGEEE
jgi:hypothetical protein